MNFLRPQLFVALGIAGMLMIFGCKTGEKSKDAHMPAAGHPEEIKDSTRLDPAGVDTFQESVSPAGDSVTTPVDTTSPQ